MAEIPSITTSLDRLILEARANPKRFVRDNMVKDTEPHHIPSAATPGNLNVIAERQLKYGEEAIAAIERLAKEVNDNAAEFNKWVERTKAVIHQEAEDEAARTQRYAQKMREISEVANAPPPSDDH